MKNKPNLGILYRKYAKKIFLIMKISFLLLFVTMFSAYSTSIFSQNATVSINMQNATVREVVSEIERQGGINFLFNDNLAGLSQRVSLSFSDQPIKDVLKSALVQADMTYEEIKDGFVVLLAKPDYLKQQEIRVTGLVTDAATGEALPGVSVFIQGTTIGTSTDIGGNYSISIPDGDAVLIFSFVGFSTFEAVVAGRTTIDVSLEPDLLALDEVIVVGYGTQRRASLSGAVDVITAAELEARPATNVLSSIQGLIPGVTITRAGGQPGREGFNLNVRGLTSVSGGNSPLILVDGNPIDDLNTLNPHDIESMSVLKDASAAIYGSRAAGGVILITTKQGSEGRPRIRFSANTGVSNLLNKVEYPGMMEFALMNREADINNNVAPFWNDERIQKIKEGAAPERFEGAREFQFFESTDWVDEFYGTGFQQDYNISIDGGSEHSDYYFSTGYNKSSGLIVGNAPDKAERFNIRMNYTYQPFENLRLDARASIERLETTELYWLDRVVNSIRLVPIFFPVKTQNDEHWFSQWGYSNPVAMAHEGAPLDRWTNRVTPNFGINWGIVDNLSFIGQASLTLGNSDTRNITKPIPYHFWDDEFAYYEYATYPNNASYSYGKTDQRNFSARLQYDNTFNEAHNISIMAGATHDEYNNDWLSAYRDNFISDELFTLNLGDSRNMSNSGGGYHWALQSLISRIGYIYRDKYIFETNIRYDGTSRFAEEQRWSLFTSFQAAWRLSEEEFIRSTGIFDNLKLRVSYGELGNQSGIGLYDYVQNINIGGQYPFGNTQRAQSASLAGMVSRNRTWETLIIRNIGLDATVLDHKLDFTFDYYLKTNKNMLVGVTLPAVLGASPPQTNNGELDTWGWELSLGWRDNLNDFNYGVRMVLSNSTNKITDLGGFDSYGPGHNLYREGYRSNLYYGFDYMGIIQDEATLNEYKQLEGVPGNIGIGDAMYRDVDGNGIISAYSDVRENGDLIILGTTDPQYLFGINLNTSWKGIDLKAFFQGVGKRTVFREGEARIPFLWPWYHPPSLFYNNTWAPERTDAKYPRLSHSDIRWWNFQHSSNNKENGAYIRLKNIQLGYNLPRTLLNRTGFIDNLRVYVSGNDLWDYHKLPGGYDPEDNSWGSNYPFSKSVSFGINVTY